MDRRWQRQGATTAVQQWPAVYPTGHFLCVPQPHTQHLHEPDVGLIKQFEEVLDDDLNISGAWGIVFEWVREMNRRIAANQVSADAASVALATWENIDKVFGLSFPESYQEFSI